MMLVERIAARLSGATALAYRRCLGEAVKTRPELLHEIGTYLAQLEARAGEEEFLDLATASKVAGVCRVLVDRLGLGMDEAQLRAVQAAVAYFVLEDDGEADTSIVGFDDDLEVLRVTAFVLGWKLPELDA